MPTKRKTKPSKAKKLTKKTKPFPTTVAQELEKTDQLLANELVVLAKEIHSGNSLGQKFVAALLTGFGTVIGATLLVALFIFILTQLSSIEVIHPFVDAVVNMVRTSYK